MTLRTIAVFILSLTLACSAARGDIRTWTSIAGTTLKAEFIKAEGDTIYLKTTDGKTRNIKLTKLCTKDQELIAQLINTVADQKKSAQAAETFHELLGNTLITAEGEEVSTDILAGKDIIGLYFSSATYKDFTAMLVAFHQAMHKEGKAMEVVFISYDGNASAMFDFMQETKAPWPAMPFSKSHRKKLGKQFNISDKNELPFELVIFDGNGNLITTNGRNELNENGFSVYDIWAAH